jgi:NAD(P)-dependent dehydrogenase (short-subunit alcohol dehydrogenase family)
MPEKTKKTVLITGCSTGIGREAVKKFQREGWNVIATMRSPQAETELNQLDGVLVTRLDVTDVASIQDALQRGYERFGVGIDVVVNNAARGCRATFEQTTDQYVRETFETNVFGVINVIQAVIGQMRRQTYGCIINVTSVTAIIATPLGSIYAATKHAVHGLTTGLAMEYLPLGVSVKSVIPGGYPTTRFGANSVNLTKTGGPELSTYADELGAHLAGVGMRMKAERQEVSMPEEVADTIYQCATEDTPIHNPTGYDAVTMVEKRESVSLQQFLEDSADIVVPKRRVR